MTGPMREIHAFKRCSYSVTTLRARYSQVEECDCNVFGHIEVIDQIEVLEDETDASAAVHGKFVL